MAKASNPAPKKQPTPPKPPAAPKDPENRSSAGKPDPVIGLRITAKREGFRRAGQPWSVQPTEIPLDGLTDDQVKALMDEHGHMLTVEEITLP